MNTAPEACEPSVRYLAAVEPSLLRQFDLIAQAPNGVARLRELILTLAVQGKLVPQDPNDEPASALLERIQAEKARLVKEGKIRKDKPLPEIAEEEKPFALPNGWEWVRMGTVGEIGSSSRVHQSDWTSEGVPFYRAREIVQLSSYGSVPSDLFISEQLFSELSAGGLIPETNDLMITGVGTIGVPYVVRDIDRFYFKDASVLILKNRYALFPYFLFYFMKSPYWGNTIHAHSMGTTVHTLTIGRACEVPFPLPPLAEQSRIVARVDELMALCDALEAKGKLETEQHARLVGNLFESLANSESAQALAENWQRIATHFDLLLDRPAAVNALEQTILQLAVRGLLVPQDPTDEPASALMQKIRNEKDRLVAAGKIKRDKTLPLIRDEDKPFELPEGWECARFPELGEFGRGKSKHRPRNDPRLFNPGKYPLIQTGEVARADQVISEYHSKYSEEGLAQSKMWPEGTLCITIAANIADTAMLGFDACFPDSVVGFVPSPIIGNTEYFLAFTATARERLLEFAPATAQKNINLEILTSVLIPIPPVREMKEIVSRITELRTLCSDLRQRVGSVQQSQSRLAEALVESVVA